MWPSFTALALCGAVTCFAADSRVKFMVTDSLGREQSCRVQSFRSIFERSESKDLAALFRKCEAAAIPIGTYAFDLGESRKGVLYVDGARVLKIIEDPDQFQGFALEMPIPNSVTGRLEGATMLQPERYRVRLIGNWGGMQADSEIDAAGSFHFTGVAYGAYTVILMRDGMPVACVPLVKGHRPIADFRFPMPEIRPAIRK